MSSRVCFFFPPRGHEHPPTLHGRLNSHLSLQRRRFPISRYAKRPDVALDAIGPLVLLPTPSSPHCTLKASEYGSLWQPPAAHSDGRPRPQKSSHSQRRLKGLTPGCLKSTVVRCHPMVCTENVAMQDLSAYRRELYLHIIFTCRPPIGEYPGKD